MGVPFLISLNPTGTWIEVYIQNIKKMKHLHTMILKECCELADRNLNQTLFFI